MNKFLNHKILISILPDGCIYEGNLDVKIDNIKSIYECSDTDITWIKPNVKDEEELINNATACAIICSPYSYSLYHGSKEKKLFIIHSDPKLLYLTINKYFEPEIIQEAFIHPTAIVDKNCIIGENVRIGAYSIIGAAIIGDNTIIHESVKIYDCVTIGKECEIREFATIGGKGLGYYKNSNGKLEHIPHLGKVILGNNVHIYPLVNIDQGTIGTTEIGNGSAIDHLVHIGHNAKVGENSILVAGSVMAGGSKVMNNTFIGANTNIRQKCIVGNNVLTGMGSVIIKDIPNNEVWGGNPAKFLKESPKELF